MTRRTERVNALLRQEISWVITRHLKDPRLSSMVSIMEVDCSPDLKQARVFVSVLGDKSTRDSTLKGLKSAAGFIHRMVNKQLNLKSIPKLEFHLDQTIERGTEMSDRIKDLFHSQTNGNEP